MTSKGTCTVSVKGKRETNKLDRNSTMGARLTPGKDDEAAKAQTSRQELFLQSRGKKEWTIPDLNR